jgi:transcriptional regulator with XRE-family HTH domain
MDLGLLQREVAEIIGVTESSIWNWEHGTEPELQYNPKIIKFLGYVPFECPDDTIGRLAWYKRAMGMNLDHLGEAMGRDPEQLSNWLSGRHYPFRKNREKIERFLDEQGVVQDPCSSIKSLSVNKACFSEGDYGRGHV